MGKRYYCDYCDKSFADNLISRKLHLSGGIHFRNKKAHYDAVKDERDILEDDLHKKPCRSFMTTGDCRFGERCQYSHLTNEDKARLSNRIAKKQKKSEQREKEKKKTLAGLSTVLDKWMEDRCRKQEEKDKKGSQWKESKQVHIPEYQLADCLKGFPSIPLSLIPPSKEDILHAEYADWG